MSVLQRCPSYRGVHYKRVDCTPSQTHAMPLLFHTITLQGQSVQNFPSYGLSKAGLLLRLQIAGYYAISSEEIGQLGSSFGYIFLLFPMKEARDHIAVVAAGHSWPPCDSPTTSRYFFSSTMAYRSLKVLKNGQQKCATCSATLLQNGLKSDVRFTTHESNLPVLQPLGC